MTPRFLTLGPEEIAELRASKTGELIIEWLTWERERAREVVMIATVHGNENPVLRAGAALTFDHILNALRTPVPIADMHEEDYRDPARRPSRKD